MADSEIQALLHVIRLVAIFGLSPLELAIRSETSLGISEKHKCLLAGNVENEQLLAGNRNTIRKLAWTLAVDALAKKRLGHVDYAQEPTPHLEQGRHDRAVKLSESGATSIPLSHLDLYNL
jgi:hypothetical protein